ncbi:MAG: TonB family protein, partial [Caldilineaceae bacterium]|nr:TonB family protein [Caldilineaceae bacterium]
MRKRSFYGLSCGLFLVAAITSAHDKSLPDQEQNAIHFYLGRIFQKLQTHKHYPKVAEQKGLSGQVVLRFTVLSDGKVIDPQIKVIGHISFGEATLAGSSWLTSINPMIGSSAPSSQIPGRRPAC